MRRFKTILSILAAVFILLLSTAAPSRAIATDLLITGVVDGPLPGGIPKAIELYVINDIPDLSIYGVGAANNGGGTDGEEFTFPAVAATAGDFIYLASESTAFNDFFGFAPNYTAGAASINGDDAIELFENGLVIDIFGEINVDGSGQPWEYLDGWAYRVSGTEADGTIFNIANWTFSGPNALDGETTNATAVTPFPTASYAPGGGGGGDTTAPLSTSFSPVDDSTGVVISTNLIAQFNENVQLGTGNIVLHLTSDDSVVETFDVSTSTQLSVSGNSVTIDPTNDLANSTEYYTVIDNGAIEDLAGNAYQGFSGTIVWSFTTAAVISGPELLINEVDADQSGTDSAEFVELYDGGGGNTDLSGLVLVFMNGSDDASYRSYDLDGFSTNANGYFVLCGNAANTANCDLDVSPDTNLIQNGADAVALYTGDAVDFPNDTPVTTANLLDAIVYDTDDSDDAALLVLLNAGQPQVNERDGGDGSRDSNQRCVNGSGGARNTNTYEQWVPTPGEENLCITIVDVSVLVQPPSSFNGWAFGAETGVGSVDFVAGPGTAPLGNGSAEFNLVDGTSGVALGTPTFSGVRLDAINQLQYSTYNSVGNNTVAPSLQINIDYDLTDASTGWQGRLVFEPYYDNTVIDGVWQTWNPLNGRWWSSGTPIVADVAQANSCPISSPCSLATILTLYPDAGVQTGALSAVLFKAGSGWLAGYQGSVDAFVILTDGTRTTFNFEPEIPVTKIHDIQGNGLVSPLEGSTVVIEGVVVGDFQNNASADNGDLNGFYVQEEDADADADPATSEGIFVFGSVPEDVVVGDFVRVQGDVVEFETSGGASSLTELSNVTVQIYGTATAMPTAANVTLPVAAISDLEQYEGMLTTFSQSLVIGEFFNFDRFGEIVLTTERLFQPTAVFEPGSIDAANLADLNSRSRITLDDGRTSQNPDPAIHPNGNVFDLTNLFRGGDLVQGVTGVIDETFGVYRIQPTQGANFTSVNPRPAAPDPVGGSLTVASFNVLNYFTTLDDSGAICGPNNDQGCRGADDADEFMRQRDKIIAAIATIDADIVGLMEIENNPSASLADLVNGLNDLVGAGTYAYVDAGTIGDDVIKVGLIYQPASVTPYGAFAILDSSVDIRFDDARNRPVLAQTFFENGTGGTVTVAINHLKSKGSSCGAGDDDPEQGNCNGTRTLAAAALVDWLATDPTGSGDADFLIIGDLNAYDKEDPIDAILAGSDDALSSADDYTDLAALFGGEFAYTFVFNGQFGYLDYALANNSLLPQVTGATIWNINADEPDILDYDTSFKQPAQDALYEANEYRASDHDPVIVGLNLDRATNANGCYVTALEGSPFSGPASIITTSDRSYNGFRFQAGRWGQMQGFSNSTCYEVYGTDNAELLVGGWADDTIFGYAGDDLLIGLFGDDTFIGGVGADLIIGNNGTDTLLDYESGIDSCFNVEIGC